jgi:hypothetical protein
MKKHPQLEDLPRMKEIQLTPIATQPCQFNPSVLSRDLVTLRRLQAYPVNCHFFAHFMPNLCSSEKRDLASTSGNVDCHLAAHEPRKHQLLAPIRNR